MEASRRTEQWAVVPRVRVRLLLSKSIIETRSVAEVSRCCQPRPARLCSVPTVIVILAEQRSDILVPRYHGICLTGAVTWDSKPWVCWGRPFGDAVPGTWQLGSTEYRVQVDPSRGSRLVEGARGLAV